MFKDVYSYFFLFTYMMQIILVGVRVRLTLKIREMHKIIQLFLLTEYRVILSDSFRNKKYMFASLLNEVRTVLD